MQRRTKCYTHEQYLHLSTVCLNTWKFSRMCAPAAATAAWTSMYQVPISSIHDATCQDPAFFCLFHGILLSFHVHCTVWLCHSFASAWACVFFAFSIVDCKPRDGFASFPFQFHHAYLMQICCSVYSFLFYFNSLVCVFLLLASKEETQNAAVLHTRLQCAHSHSTVSQVCMRAAKQKNAIIVRHNTHHTHIANANIFFFCFNGDCCCCSHRWYLYRIDGF